jgi:aspartate aminotransferase
MSQSVPTSFSAEAVPQAPEDPLFGLMAAYRADTFDKKVDLGIGAYRDNDAKPWVLPVVKKVIRATHEFEQFLTRSSRQRRSSVKTPP